MDYTGNKLGGIIIVQARDDDDVNWVNVSEERKKWTDSAHIYQV